ncbi:MAG TPA: hypothetical protein VGB98_08560 [Pyrinomonadaceae bacterium]|jgi:hypothetical protein
MVSRATATIATDGPGRAPAELLRARTTEEMIEAVPRLGEFDSLGAVPALAGYDHRATGWVTSVLLWLGKVLAVACAMSCVAGLLAIAGWILSEWLRQSADGLAEGLGGTPLRLLLGVAELALCALAFNYAGPRRWLADSMRALRLRLRLRVLLLGAIRSQVARNRRIVADDWRGAVCLNCLSRYELHRVRFSYWRWLGFARCRECRDDRACHARARSIEGWLDGRMGANHEQAGDAVRVNLLHRLPPLSLPLPADLDELVVAHAGDEGVETFIFFYRGAQPRTRLPRPGRLRFRLTEDSSISQMSWRQLKRNFRYVSAAAPRRK